MATRTARSVASSASCQPVAPPQLETFPVEKLALDGDLLESRLRLAAARTGDHPSIHAFLLSIFHGPTAAEFHAQLDEPGYQAANRLVVKNGEQVVAHMRLAPQSIQMGSRSLTAVRFMDLGTAPEIRGCGVAKALIASGQRVARESGAMIGMVRTRFPVLFSHEGWSLCGCHSYSSAAPRAVLAELARAAEERTPEAIWPPRAAEQITVRPLRRVELPAVVRLYDAASRKQTGWPVRSEEYWDWLLARGACDRIYVASSSADSANLATLPDSIVGYACVRQSRIVELITAERRSDAAEQLLIRICADAREQDGWAMRLDAPPADPLHDVMVAAGGKRGRAENASDEHFMAKVFDPFAVLRELLPTFAARAQASGYSSQWELGIELRVPRSKASGLRAAGLVERYRLRCRSGKLVVESGVPSRHTVVICQADFAPLVLGLYGSTDLAAGKRLATTSKQARELAAGLFPGQLWWRPVLDDLLA